MNIVIFFIVLLSIIAILLVLFIAWFITLKINGKCPLCVMKKILHPTKVTINLSEQNQYGNGAAKTPPMGWSSWNTFRNQIDQDLILETAAAMKNSGLADVGYQFINLDDCWQSSQRDDMGRLQGDLSNFSRGMPALIKDINDLGLKAGLYSSNGTLTCEDLPASLGNEELDAKTFASWGCEFFKYDFCHHKNLSGDTPIIEALEFTREGTSEKMMLSADKAVFSGRAKMIRYDSKNGGGKGIGYLSHHAGEAAFTADAERSGKYILTIHYHKLVCRHEQYLQVIINSEIYEILFPKTGAFSASSRYQLYVELKNGKNTIQLVNPIVTRADSEYIQYSRMGRALMNASKDWAAYTGMPEKPIIYSICEWGSAFPWNWGAKAGNLWRTTPDIFPNWKSIYLIYLHNIRLYSYARPGAWNDPDMLEVGNGKLTEDENKAHFSLWCMMAAPLILGNDIRKFVDGTGNPVTENPVLKIVTNKNLINIDQDALGKPAKRIQRKTSVDYLARPLNNGDVVLCIFNTSHSKKNIDFDLTMLASDEYLALAEPFSQYKIHDLWSDERFSANEIKVTIPKHAVKVYRIHNA